jgi:glycosyltransferase involved in cell wall biosynthesis
LRVLYVGSVGQRKGISYLLRAMELLGSQAELSLVGRCAHPSDELVAQLNRHRWTHSLPHEKVLETMRNQDVLVLPTLFEGRALVVLEALSQGLPVISTLNSGTEDVVLDGVSGFIVPIRSAESIAAALTRLAENPELLAEMSAAAQRIASEWGWEDYRERLLDVVTGCLGAHSGN